MSPDPPHPPDDRAPDPERTLPMGGASAPDPAPDPTLAMDAKVPPAPDATPDPTLAMGANVPAAPPSNRSLKPERALPESIGSYRILGKLGEGGMGMVYEAEQQNPRRQVALKVIRGGALVDETQVKMFQREAETLARLKHPNIGAIFESGCTEDGQHFFAMELVRGVTLSKYLEEPAPPFSGEEIVRRLRIFQILCDAVHYAHQRGVIHRDLKPSNVVVAETGSGTASVASGSQEAYGVTAKILDFGLARITDQDVAAASLVSNVGVIKGTLAYMSPEQARGIPDEIDLRTDIYSLAIILYEMLTGSRPYDLAAVSIPDAIRVICDVPSRSLRAAWVGKRPLDRDLETIVKKGLAKEPNGRYKSAAALSEDLDRYLTDQPILARPPSTMYTLGKFAKRNKVLVGGAVATGLTLVAGVVVSTTLGMREASQRRAAQEARGNVEVVAEFQSRMLQEVDAAQMGARLVEDLRGQLAKSLEDGGMAEAERTVVLDEFNQRLRQVNATDTALDLLDQGVLSRASQAVSQELQDQPKISARLDRTLGETYFGLGLFGRAEELLRRSLATYEELGPAFRVEKASVHRMLARVFVFAGRLDEAEPELAAAVAGHQGLGELHEEVMHDESLLALLRRERKDLEGSLETYEDITERRRRVPGSDRVALLSDLDGLAWVHYELKHFATAESIQVAALAEAREVLGAEHVTTLALVNNLAVNYVGQGRMADAEPLYLEDLAVSRQRLGNFHEETRVSITNLGRMHFRMGNFEQAERYAREAVEVGRDLEPRTLGGGIGLECWGSSLVELGRFAEAEAPLREAWSVFAELMGEEFIGCQKAAEGLVRVYTAQGDTAQLAVWAARAEPPAEEPDAD